MLWADFRGVSSLIGDPRRSSPSSEQGSQHERVICALTQGRILTEVLCLV